MQTPHTAFTVKKGHSIKPPFIKLTGKIFKKKILKITTGLHIIGIYIIDGDISSGKLY